MRKKGFTLIELLVVIAIIALLMSIVMPSLGKAKVFARKIICRNNIRQQALGVMLYADDSDSWVPTQDIGEWLWDMSFWSTNQISDYAGFDNNEVYYCPANRLKKADDARFWQFSWMFSFSGVDLFQPVAIRDESGLSLDEQKAQYRVMPVLYMFDKIIKDENTGKLESQLPPVWETGEASKWISKLSKVKSTSSTILLMDNVISNASLEFFQIEDGGMWADCGVYDNSNHASNHRFSAGGGFKPDGANVAYADGSVDWLKYEQMEHRITQGLWFWW